jgi:hypothetical protein
VERVKFISTNQGMNFCFSIVQTGRHSLLSNVELRIQSLLLGEKFVVDKVTM